MSTWSRIADLPLRVEELELETLERQVGPEFTRYTTVVHLRGADHEGLGEDVTYDGLDHVAIADLDVDVAGQHTLASFSELLEGLDLFPSPPVREFSRHYRRWAFESAALDLALRQGQVSLADAVGRKPRPLRYVVSLRLGNPSSAEPIRRLNEMYPGIRYKLDPVNDWTPELISELAAIAPADCLDLKGHYTGTPVDVETDPELYRRVIEAFPRAAIEDPDVNTETRPILAPHRDRISWDAPIHSVADIAGAPWRPRVINIKPSRFGSLRRLLDTYEFCQANGIRMYGGGQSELGVGRGHIQALASIFHPDSGNDVAPGEFNSIEVPRGLPRSPLEPRLSETGFRWEG